MERRGFGHSSFDRFDQPKPVKIGEEYDVKITDVGAKGDGICKVENFIIFVPNVKKGENCKIKIKEVARKFAIAEKVGSADVKEESDEGKEEDELPEVEEKLKFKDVDEDKEDTF
ncbi:MAG: TRAM domain-containing protein [Candidatus Aenigmatarchaeota archaeon]